MSQADTNQRFLFEHTEVRGELAQLGDTLTAIKERHEYPDIVMKVLGEFVAAVSLLAARVKVDGSIVLQAQGEGQINMLMAEIVDHKNIRAIARFDNAIDESKPLLDKGRLAITIEPYIGQRYQGIIELEKDNVGAALEDYFERSEQLKTRIWLGSDGNRAGGLLLQALPHAAEESSLQREDTDAWDRLVHLASTVKQEELLALNSEELLFRLYHEESIKVYEPTTLQFSCSCSKARVARAISQLGETEARGIVAEQGAIEADCQFCRHVYRFNSDDLDEMFDSSRH